MNYQIYKDSHYDDHLYSLLICYNDDWYYWSNGLWKYDSWPGNYTHKTHKTHARNYWKYMIQNGNVVPCSKLEFLIRTGHAIEHTLYHLFIQPV